VTGATAYARAMCDTMVRVEPGRVLFAKNSGRDANEAQLLEWHPAADHPPGASLRCTHIEIPQVGHTHAVLLSRPFWMWGAEMGTNEHGVTIGNEAVFTRQPYAATGLTGMDLLRLALERAGTAMEAVEAIVDLLRAHGQGGGCGLEDPSFTYHNSFLVADHRHAVVVETAGSHHAIEVVGDGARSISNGLTIPGFAERHADLVHTRGSACRVRRHLTEQHAARAAGPVDLMRALREHGDGRVAPRYHLVNGAMAAPCMHAGGLVAASQTAGSWVSELTADGARHWATGTAAPCTSLFKPVSVGQPLDLGPGPTDRYDPATPWWRHERLHRAALRDPARLLPLFAPDRDEVERRWLAAPPDPTAAFAEADELTGRWLAAVAAVAVDDVRPGYVRRFWRTRNERAGIADVLTDGALVDGGRADGALADGRAGTPAAG
jgi:secernin